MKNKMMKPHQEAKMMGYQAGGAVSPGRPTVSPGRPTVSPGRPTVSPGRPQRAAGPGSPGVPQRELNRQQQKMGINRQKQKMGLLESGQMEPNRQQARLFANRLAEAMDKPRGDVTGMDGDRMDRMMGLNRGRMSSGGRRPAMRKNRLV